MKYLLAIFLIGVSCFLFACGGDSATEHFDRGEDYRNHGQYELAIEAYKKAIALNPNYAKAYNGLGFIYTSADSYEPDLAFEFYKKAIALNPNYADVYKNLGWLYRKRRRYDLAIESYKKAIAINPNDAEALSRLASSYRMEGNFDLAFEFYYKAIATNPNLALAHYCLACVHSLKNNKDLAVESLQKAISLDRKSIELAKHSKVSVKKIEYYTKKGIVPYEQLGEGEPLLYNKKRASARLKEIQKLESKGTTIKKLQQKYQDDVENHKINKDLWKID